MLMTVFTRFLFSSCFLFCFSLTRIIYLTFTRVFRHSLRYRLLISLFSHYPSIITPCKSYKATWIIFTLYIYWTVMATCSILLTALIQRYCISLYVQAIVFENTATHRPYILISIGLHERDGLDTKLIILEHECLLD